VKELQQEAWLRLNSYTNLNKASQSDIAPKPFIKLADNEPYALVVDSKLSRLYVYHNQVGGIPKLIKDFYITQGKQGAYKTQEGDYRTPLGVYFISGAIPGVLPAFYGYGALGLDYPNLWDKRLGRTGHGIWLHGTPPDTYSRPPYASEGCVVLANPDVESIFKLSNAGSMPILITDKLEWVKPSVLENTQKEVQFLLEQWRKANEIGDSIVLNQLYSANFRTENSHDKLGIYNKATWLSKKLSNTGNKTALNNVSVIEYPGEIDMLLTKFDYVSSTGNTQRKQLYWKKEGKAWKVVLENSL
jgi:murein L,D-transpeptidase YafK